MQVLFVPNLLLFFYKFFLFFFCKEGLKEIQPPSQCFRPLWTWLGLNFQGFVCIVHFFVWFILCCKIVHFYAGGFKKPQPLHCVFDYLQISRVEKASTVSQWFRLLANRVQKALTPFFSQCFCLSLCFWLVLTPRLLSQCFCLPMFLASLFAMSSILQYFNYSKNPTLTMPLCLVFDSNMFPRSHNYFDSGPKSPLARAWPKFPKQIVNPIGITKSRELQNPSFSFAVREVLPKILNFINLDLDEIMELSNSQSDLQTNPLGKK